MTINFKKIEIKKNSFPYLSLVESILLSKFSFFEIFNSQPAIMQYYHSTNSIRVHSTSVFVTVLHAVEKILSDSEEVAGIFNILLANLA